ncbi:ABC transporter substrate-binding protein [Paracoccus saliphilus]|uniref:ABC transporter substrate-binding protein n=1 Tax=Paracoccus saliphilus TaxID=405559 RepID=A0AA45W176_9RHOB|nr:ABC transporter substrate-binding protein [Paracoccus saliphilus]WCR03494.1 ABC transporter substrate-binding protein [Paracoccus saliphilus]SIS54683.1 iron complex transport system substrate-binding protein [Paracoccus saliphilus]
MNLPFLSLIAISALITNGALAAETEYPLTIDNCGVEITFDGPPENIVSIGQAATETLYALGAEDQMAGTALWFNAVLPEFADANAAVERISDNAPSFEGVVNKRPGFVPTMFEWMIGPKGVVGTREQFADLGIPAYVMPPDCEGKDNLVGADGTRLAPFDIATLYKSIKQMAAIMDRQDRGSELIVDLQAREAAAVERARAMDLLDASAVVWFSSAEMERDPFVAGQKGIPAWMFERLGLRNVIESDEEWPTVGWESIAKADPSVIVIARMDRRRFPADDHEKKLEFLKSDPVTSRMTAVKEDRIVILDAEAMHASIRLIDGLETLTDAMEALTK